MLEQESSIKNEPTTEFFKTPSMRVDEKEISSEVSSTTTLDSCSYSVESHVKLQITPGCIRIHDDALNEGWGPFLRIRVGIDVSKPLLHGQTVTFPWMDDELWLDYRYERLLDFCYECGIIGHVFDKCPSFLEKLDEGKELNLTYGPWLEESSLPRSSYDRYRQDFSKANVRNKITFSDAYLYSNDSTSYGNATSVKNCNKKLISLSSSSLDTETLLPITPATNPSSSQKNIKELVSSLPQDNLVQPISITGFEPGSSTGKDSRMSSLFSKRQLTTSGGNVRNVLKRCCTRLTPLSDTTNTLSHQHPDPSSEMSTLSLKADGNGASLAQADAQPRQSP
uniref:CCHC-type domain-containing protein n=1 Tax=Cannabis sativa TaxID=3483 RepID=A0A803QDE9_CANSA